MLGRGARGREPSEAGDWSPERHQAVARPRPMETVGLSAQLSPTGEEGRAQGALAKAEMGTSVPPSSGDGPSVWDAHVG